MSDYYGIYFRWLDGEFDIFLGPLSLKESTVDQNPYYPSGFVEYRDEVTTSGERRRS